MPMKIYFLCASGEWQRKYMHKNQFRIMLMSNTGNNIGIKRMNKFTSSWDICIGYVFLRSKYSITVDWIANDILYLLYFAWVNCNLRQQKSFCLFTFAAFASLNDNLSTYRKVSCVLFVDSERIILFLLFVFHVIANRRYHN